jgi:hypothetical protein
MVTRVAGQNPPPQIGEYDHHMGRAHLYAENHCGGVTELEDYWPPSPARLTDTNFGDEVGSQQLANDFGNGGSRQILLLHDLSPRHSPPMPYQSKDRVS